MGCTKDSPRCKKPHDKTPLNPCCRSKIEDLLIFTTRVLEENGIKYWLDYGTILGAVRDKDFIPWDDDADISILETDPHLLQSLLSKDNIHYELGIHFKDMGFHQIYYSKTNSLHIDIFRWYNDNGILRRSSYLVSVFVIGNDWEGKFDYLSSLCQVIYLPRTDGISSTMLRKQTDHVLP